MPKQETPEETKSETKRFKPRLIRQSKNCPLTPSNVTSKRRPVLRVIITKATILVLLLFSLPASAKSSVNPLRQSYIVHESDRIGGLELRRTYSSGSVFRGHFGAGWCSEIDGKILLYEGGEIQYRGCDLNSAELVDARASAKSIRRNARGFERTREDGATMVFDPNGNLERVSRREGWMDLTMDRDGFPTGLKIRNGKIAAAYPIEIEPRNSESAFALVTAIGSTHKFEYTAGSLSHRRVDGQEVAIYQYDNLLNMRSRIVNDGSETFESETIDYDDVLDRVIRIERHSALRRERLLFAISRKEKSGMIEMKMEVERGAETHPVRILYNMVTERLSLIGDRGIARQLLDLIRS